MRVLLIEDSLSLVMYLSQGLREAGYAVDTATDGEAGLQHAEAASYDVVILDLMLPKLDGLTVLERIRGKGNATPVLVLTARDRTDDRVKGLDSGADDYLVKPFAFEELLARVRALIRRRYRSLTASTIRIGDLEIDTVAKVVRRAGAVINLSAREYELLEYLAARRGQVVSRAQIWDHLYDFASDPSSNVVDVYIGYLRKKIDQGEPKLIHTRRGQGYVLGEGE